MLCKKPNLLLASEWYLVIPAMEMFSLSGTVFIPWRPTSILPSECCNLGKTRFIKEGGFYTLVYMKCTSKHAAPSVPGRITHPVLKVEKLGQTI